MARKKPIISPLGQWAYPGEVTIIPSSDITMKGVNYPVLGIDDLGNQQMMMPGQDYTFPGNYVTEIPQMGKGGLRQWFDEKWVDVKTGKACGRSGKDKDGRPYPACRPSKRVNETTPKTTSEMSSSEKAKFKREKTSGKRIDYNHKRRQDGGEWLDDEPEVNPKIGWNSGNRYSYDKKGNLIYTNHPLSFDYGVEQFIEHAINNKSGWLGNSLNDYEIDFLKNAKNKIQNLDVWPTSLEFQVQTQVDKLNPSLDELINVTQNIYPDQYAIDNSFSKASKSRIDLPASAFENDIKERYVIPEILKNSINKRFGTLPTTRDDSYSPNRIWTTKVKNDEDSNVGARFATDEDNSKYAYILTPNSKKASDLSKEKINTKKENIENLLSSADNKFYENLYLKYPDYIQYPGNYNNPEIGLFGDIKNILPNQMWNRAEQMRVEMLNNPEIKDWADLHNVNLSRGNEDSKQNLVIDGFAPKVPESAYANRLVKAGLPVSTPDYSYGADDTYIVQDPSKFNLAGYFPIPKDYDEENAKQLIAKKLGIKPEQLNNKDYLIHYNKTPITEYKPGKKYGGWLEEYQAGGIRRPIYTSNPRDPRIGSYRDSLNLYNEQNRLNILNNKTNYPQEAANFPPIIKNNLIYVGDPNKGGYVNPKIFSSNIPTLSKDIHGNLKQQYKKPVQPVIYKKPEVSPIYTSDPNDPRLRSYNDSLSLYNQYLKPAEINKTLKEIKNDSRFRYYRPSNRTELNNFPGKIKPILGTEFDFSRIDSDLISGRSTKHNYYPTYDSSGRIIPGEIGTHLSFKKPVQPYIYRKPEVVPEVIETPITPVPVVEPPKPSLFVSNIDRDMYTPGGGMAREYNIGVTLQDGNRKSFRTEKEFQDWKVANNLDISKAKVTEGRGYSYDYPENKKYGGWLSKYQPGGGWAGWTPNVGKPYMRTSPAGNAGYSDNTRVVNQNTNVSAANRKAAEAAEYAKRVGSISQGETKSAYEKAREASSLVAQAQQRKGSADPLDYVLDIVNPATYGFAGADLIGNTAMGVNNLAKGNFSEAAGNAFDAGMNALYLAPVVAELRGPLYTGIPKTFVNKSKAELERQAGVDWLRNWYGQPEIKQRFNQQIYNPAVADDLVMPIYKKNVVTDVIEKPNSTINLDKSVNSDFASAMASTMSKEKYAELKYGFKNDPIISLKYGKDIPGTHKKYLGVNSGFGNNMGGYTNVYPEHPEFFYNKFNSNSQWKPTVKGTSIHEGTHWLTTGDKGLAESTKAMFKEPFDLTKRISKQDKYLTKPTEIHARLNELRSQYNLGPTVTQSQVDKIIADGLKGNTTVQKRFFELLKDNKSLTNLFNTAMGISAPLAAASQLPEQKNGGWLNKYK